MRYRAVIAVLLLFATAGGAAAPPPKTQCEDAPLDGLGPLPMRGGPAQP